MSNNLRENDIFVSTLLNPQANVNDLVNSGVNANNTQLLTPEDYKSSDFVKKQFTKEDGKFDDDLFNKAYQVAAQKYQDLNDKSLLKDINQFIEYNPGDIYAPNKANYKDNNAFNISRISNPYESITGIRSLFGTVESNKSVRELAQKNKIFDSETGEYLDKSAEDLGLFGGLFSKPLVYAKWHEDGTHIDPITGREVKHKKGEYRVNEDGKFFTETIGKKQGYDEEFVALSDILTKEDSWLNKIDFFDSDDKEKSAAGTIMKTAAAIFPYLIPGFNGIWGGITAGVAMASVFPTFAKALEGLVVGDKETGFTKSMNLMENYFKRLDTSISDKGQQQSFGLEAIGQTVADIFAQLYQMRSAAALSKLSMLDWDSANAKAYKNFMQTHGQEVGNLIRTGKLKPDKKSMSEFWKDIADKTPELKAVIDKQSKLSRGLSMGYMTMITASDVYKEALEGGYSRRTAGAATLAAVLSQYLMMNTLDDRISSWFLDSVVGYNEFANRKVIRDSLKPLWERIEKTVNDVPGMATTEKQKSFAGLFDKIFNGVKNGYYHLLDGTSEFWSRSIAETVEEISEEAMMDVTKGSFDALAHFGFLGDNNKQASFNTIDNTFSKEGLIRYAQNALGGFVGGGLFHLQEHYIEPWLKGEKIPKTTEIDLIKGIQNGESEHYKQLARQLGNRDKNIMAEPFNLNGNSVGLTSNGGKTRGDVIADSVIQHIEYLQGLLGEYGGNLSPDELVSKVIQDREIRKVLQDSDINNLILDDFDSNVADLVKVREQLDPLKEKEKPTPDEEKQIKDLEKQKKELEDKVQDFFSGKQQEYYLKAALAYVNPSIRDNLTSISLYQFAKAVTGQEWDAITDKDSVKQQYEDWKNLSDKKQQIKRMVDTMDTLEPIFSPKYKEYAKRYSDIRKYVVDNILSEGNFHLVDSIEGDNFQTLLDLSTAVQNSGLKGVTLEDILKVDPETIVKPIANEIYQNNQVLFDTLAQAGGVTTDQFLDSFSKILSNDIGRYPIEQWDTHRFDVISKQFFNEIKKMF